MSAITNFTTNEYGFVEARVMGEEKLFMVYIDQFHRFDLTTVDDIVSNKKLTLTELCKEFSEDGIKDNEILSILTRINKKS